MRLNELLKFKDIVIQCHNFPDADAVASGFALYKYLTINGIRPTLFYSGPQKISKTNMLIMVEKLEIPITYISTLDRKPELLVTVDCFYGESNVNKFYADNIAVIDHHICKGTPPLLSEIRSNYGSCSSIMFKMLADEGIDANKDQHLITALYYGLYMDTNGLSEISHPADRDLRDFALFDRQLIGTLKNSNLSKDEMKIVGDTLRTSEYNDEYCYAIGKAETCDPNILGIISDMLLQVDTVENCVVFCPGNAGYKFSVRSCTNKVNASEFAKYIAHHVGNGGGHANKAGGFVSAFMSPDTDLPELICSRIDSYHRYTNIIHAGQENTLIPDMKKYVKRSLIVGYVPSTDIVPAGTDIFIRMLEADTQIKADDNIYIMVGVAGEVYPIEKEVFEENYHRCRALPDISEEYPPTVLDRENNCNRPLTEFINGCVSTGGAVIYAKELTKNTKVFTKWDKENYLFGAPGDYLAARADDISDIYIIKHDIFVRSYDPV